MNLRERLEILGLASGRILEPIEALGYTPEEIEHKEESFPEEILKAPTLLTYSLLPTSLYPRLESLLWI